MDRMPLLLERRAPAPRTFTRSLPPDISARVLTLDDLPALQALRHEVVATQLLHPDCYRLEAESPDFPRSHLGERGAGPRGMAGGLFDGHGRLVGYGSLSFAQPGVPSRSDALEIAADERSRIAYLSSAMVLQQRHGEGLHHALIEWRLAWSAALELWHVVSATWPGNHLSWGNLTAHGLQGKKLVDVAGGLPRILFHRDLRRMDAPAAAPVQVDLQDVDRLRSLIADGWWVWRLMREPGQYRAQLAQPASPRF